MGTSGDKVLFSDICDGYHGVSGKLPQYIAFGAFIAQCFWHGRMVDLIAAWVPGDVSNQSTITLGRLSSIQMSSSTTGRKRERKRFINDVTLLLLSSSLLQEKSAFEGNLSLSDLAACLIQCHPNRLFQFCFLSLSGFPGFPAVNDFQPPALVLFTNYEERSWYQCKGRIKKIILLID